MTRNDRRELGAESRQDRQAAYAARVQRVRELWPVMSVRDIAIEVDMTAGAVLSAAHKIGLKCRPFAAQPDEASDE